MRASLKFDSWLKNENTKDLLDFLEYRFNLSNGKNGYRGLTLSQHNRWEFNFFDEIMNLLKEYQTNNFLEIPPGDSKDIFNRADIDKFAKYIKLTTALKEKTGKGTINSIKKNTFPDLARMRVIYRYKFDKNKNIVKLDPYFRSSVNLICLSEKASQYFNNESVNDKRNDYNKFSKNILEEITKDLYDVIVSLNGHIKYMEFLFFFTFLNFNYKDKVFSLELVIDFIARYRKLEKQLKISIKEKIKEHLDSKKYKNLSRSEKKSWDNFKNQTSQIFGIIKHGKLFYVDGEGEEQRIVLNSYNDNSGSIIKKRSLEAKKNYFLKNATSVTNEFRKESTFELDHIVPFSLSNSNEEVLEIDDYMNLLWISADKHNYKSRRKNKFMIVERGEGTNLILKSIFDDQQLILEYMKDYVVDLEKIDEIISYNKYILGKKEIY